MLRPNTADDKFIMHDKLIRMINLIWVINSLQQRPSMVRLTQAFLSLTAKLQSVKFPLT